VPVKESVEKKGSHMKNEATGTPAIAVSGGYFINLAHSPTHNEKT
jgi:hypothetical protein